MFYKPLIIKKTTLIQALLLLPHLSGAQSTEDSGADPAHSDTTGEWIGFAILMTLSATACCYVWRHRHEIGDEPIYVELEEKTPAQPDLDERLEVALLTRRALDTIIEVDEPDSPTLRLSS